MQRYIFGYVAGHIDDYPCVAEITLLNSSISNIYDDIFVDSKNAKYFTDSYKIVNVNEHDHIDILKKFIPHKSLVCGEGIVFNQDIRSCPTITLAFYINYDIAHRIAFGMSQGFTPVTVHTYHDNGSVESVGTYVHGVKHGIITYYDTFGNIIDTCEYIMGSIKKDKEVESLTSFLDSIMKL